MKKIFILLTSFVFLTSCENNNKHNNQHNDETIEKRVEYLGSFRNGIDGIDIYLYKIDGHDYGAIFHGSLTHLESCKVCNSRNDKMNE